MSETINARAAASSLVTGDKIPVWSLAAASGRSATLELVFNLIRDTYRASNITVSGNRVFEGSITLPARSVVIAAIDATGTPSSANYLRGDGEWATPAGSGDVVGPASAVTNNFTTFADGTGKLIADSGYGASSFATPGHLHTEAALNLSDNTTANATTSKHGLLPKLDGESGHFLNGAGSWATPSGGSGSSAYHYASPATADTTWTITHSLGQKYVIVACAVAGVQVIPSEVTFTSDSVVTITWASAVTGNAVVIG